MQQSVPPVVSGDGGQAASALRVRLCGLAVVLAVAASVVVLHALTASSSGYGTHQQLLLPPCGFLAGTGYPCPGCGVTTSLTHMAHLNLVSAWDAQPFGVLFGLESLAAALAGALQAAMGVRVLRRIRLACRGSWRQRWRCCLAMRGSCTGG